MNTLLYDQLEDALTQLEEWTAEEPLESIGSAKPEFFERLVLKLLHAMGFGANENDLQHVGGSGDGGIDGVISLDRLGLERFLFRQSVGTIQSARRLFKHSTAPLRDVVRIRESSSQPQVSLPAHVSSLS